MCISYQDGGGGDEWWVICDEMIQDAYRNIFIYIVLITSLSSDSFGSQWLPPLSSSFYWFFASYLEKFTSEAGLLKLPKTIWESWLFHTFVIVYNGGIFGIFGIFGILQQL